MRYKLIPFKDGTHVWVPEPEEVPRIRLRQLSNYAKASEGAAEQQREDRAKGGRSRAGKFPDGVEAIFEAAQKALAAKGYKRIGDARLKNKARLLLLADQRLPADKRQYNLKATDLKEHDARRWRELRRQK